MAALAWQLAALAMGPRRAELLTAPAPEASSTHASTRDGVAQGPVLALAPVAAVRAPVVAVAACKRGAESGLWDPHGLPSGWGQEPTARCSSHLCTSPLNRRQEGESGWKARHLRTSTTNSPSHPIITPAKTLVSSIQVPVRAIPFQPMPSQRPSPVLGIWTLKLFTSLRPS